MEEWGELCTPTRDDDYSFQGWYTQPNGQENEITATSLVTGHITVYAKWGIPPVCKRATTLHTATCSRTQGGCYAAGYNEGATTNSKNTKTITYGNTSTTEGTLKVGDAFDCDVNSDGIYDSSTERFYYVSNYYDSASNIFDNTKAVLIYYKNISEYEYSTKEDIQAVDSNATAYDNIHGPVTAYKYLPNQNLWTNSYIIYPGERNIINTIGTKTTLAGEIVNLFTYNQKSARLLTYQELQAACGSSITSDGSLDIYNFLLENTLYDATNNSKQYWWLENPYPYTFTYVVSAINTYSRYAGYRTVTSYSGVRPAITVLKSNIEY